MSLSQETTNGRESQRTPWVPSKQDVHWPMRRLSWDNNILLNCGFHVPVDKCAWTHPLLMKEAGMINQDPDAFFDLTNHENMNCAKRVVDSYLFQVQNSLEGSTQMKFYWPSNYQHFYNISHPHDSGPSPSNKFRKELLDAFDEMDFHDAYKSIIDIEQSLVTKKRKHLADEGEVCILRIHWFMAFAVSNLIMQYGEDMKQNNDYFRITTNTFNVFDVLMWKLNESPYFDYDYLEDTELDTLLKDHYFKDYSMLSVREMKARALALHAKVNEQAFSLEKELIQAEHRDFLLSMYRLSCVYFALRPDYFSNTLENYPLFWQIYAELKGRIVIVSDVGCSKFFAPFGFEDALSNYFSTTLRSGEPVYSAQQLAQSSIGVESFFCSTFKTHLLKDESSQVFWPAIKKITARSLKLCKKESGKLTDDKAHENDKVGENDARIEEDDSPNEKDEFTKEDKVGATEACTEEEDSSSESSESGTCHEKDDSSSKEVEAKNDKALENDKVDVDEAEEKNNYSFFLRLV